MDNHGGNVNAREERGNMLKRITALTLAAILCLSLLPVGALAFSPDFLKANITKISVGAPITGVDGRKYLPVDVHITPRKTSAARTWPNFSKAP